MAIAQFMVASTAGIALLTIGLSAYVQWLDK
jgi:hypothetical protein